jgi:alpha-glucosidase
MTHAPWWRDAVCYQIYVRSFADADGDGVGDLAGATSRLPYLAELGIDAVWLTPFYPSPQADHGYDVSDYCDVDPLFGDLTAFDELLEQAHHLGIRIIVDIVPNHSSDQHPWFRAAMAGSPGSRERGRYVFRDGRGDGDQPPNNWLSMFGGPAWTRVPDGQWYLHLFDTGQPDFCWANPEVGDEFERVLRFWLDRGVDGFRIDVANALVKADGLPDLTDEQLRAESGELVEHTLNETGRPYQDQPGVHEVYRRWHRVLAEYPGDRMAIAEAWVGTAESLARYVRPDELQQAFNFLWLQAEWSADSMRAVVRETFSATDLVDASPTWVLSNHDVVRTVTRFGGGARGLDRARSSLLAILALPGSAYLYQGEELELPQVDIGPEHRQDPTFLNGRGVGRDGCRVPMPWTAAGGDGSAYGFSPSGGALPWLPLPDGWGQLSVEAQQADPASTLRFVRDAVRVRRRLAGSLGHTVDLPEVGPDVLVVRRPSPEGAAGLVCVLACGAAAVPLAPLRVDPDTAVLTSRAGAVLDGALQPDTAAWFHPG